MEDFKDIFLLLRDYFQKQKENIALGATESTARLFFVAAVGLIMIVLSSITLLFTCFALAYWINSYTNSNVIGFASIAGVILLFTLLFWFRRKQWVLNPIAKLMVKIFLNNAAPEENTTTSPTK